MFLFKFININGPHSVFTQLKLLTQEFRVLLHRSAPGTVNALKRRAQLVESLRCHFICRNSSPDEAHATPDVIVDQFRINKFMSNNGGSYRYSFTGVQIRHTIGMGAPFEPGSCIQLSHCLLFNQGFFRYYLNDG